MQYSFLCATEIEPVWYEHLLGEKPTSTYWTSLSVHLFRRRHNECCSVLSIPIAFFTALFFWEPLTSAGGAVRDKKSLNNSYDVTCMSGIAALTMGGTVAKRIFYFIF